MRLLELGYELPKNWREATISDVTSKVGSGATPRGGSSVYTNNGIPLVRSQNVLDNSFSNAGLAFLSDQSASSLKNVELRANDVLLNITGDSILRCCLVPDVMIGGRVNQHVAIIRASDAVIPLYLQKWLVQDWFKDFMLSHSAGATRKAITKGQILSFPIALPPLPEQRRIAEVLGALDDKIESNLRVRNLCRDLGGNLVADTVRSAPSTQLEHYAASISRGVTPQYYKDEDASPVLVLNQKCIRNGWVTPELARLMTPRAREKSQAIARLDDLLVNSTGQGTLGRVARWDSDDPIYVDSHVTVVKADPRRIYPVLMPYLVFPLQDEIEHMATGSTGQTELSPSRLAQLNVPLLSLEEQRPLSARLVALEAQAHYCQVQSLKLTELRDALLPELMSGRMRVDEAGCLVSEALDEEVRSV